LQGGAFSAKAVSFSRSPRFGEFHAALKLDRIIIGDGAFVSLHQAGLL
jgi:hypothetical protein